MEDTPASSRNINNDNRLRRDDDTTTNNNNNNSAHHHHVTTMLHLTVMKSAITSSTKIEFSNHGFRYFEYNWNINRAAKSEKNPGGIGIPSAERSN